MKWIIWTAEMKSIILTVVYAKKWKKFSKLSYYCCVLCHYLINNCWSWLEDIGDCFSFYCRNNLNSGIGTNRLGVVVDGLTCSEHTITLDDSGLALVAFWAHRTLPVGCVRPLGTNVVREAQAVNQFGSSPLWTFLNQMKRGGNVRLWMEGDRLRLFQWNLHWNFYWLWTGVSKWRGGFVIWKKTKILFLIIIIIKLLKDIFFFSPF